jgi:spermidine/putrescine transport system ATP-binding protein
MANNRLSNRQQTSESLDTKETILEIVSIQKNFGKLRAVEIPELKVYDGEFFTLLGPSGSGKSTLLRIVCGLETPTSGRLWLNRTDITDVPANKRSTALIFQNFRLFPHKTVGENVAFPLKMDGSPKSEYRKRAEEMLEFVNLGGYSNRYPKQLSGGEQQRVALARGLISEPDVLLLDEPLASLDRNLRQRLEVELRRYQRRLGTTFIYVTHNQEEALRMSDRIAIMNDAEVEQVGEPMDVYNNPQSAFTAKFLGETNTIEGKVTGLNSDVAYLSTNGSRLAGQADPALVEGETGQLCIKSEDLSIHPSEEGSVENKINGTLRDRMYTGKVVEYLIAPDKVDIVGEHLVVTTAKHGAQEVNINDSVAVTWNLTDAIVFPE